MHALIQDKQLNIHTEHLYECFPFIENVFQAPVYAGCACVLGATRA